ncbi:hypothetical protein [Microbacterium sp. TPU 3598]|uniref:hypothetical protein n=1 Tax=Microbacterium sp. TPU 3598 TaxID=1938334 RepID=UPI0012FD8C83|nr:hypothetical protein [Microbacterium sp. TPU 3598]
MDAPRSWGAVRRALRRYRWGVSALAVLLLALGTAIGGAVFAPRDGSIPLTAAQQERREVLAAADFDPGSIRAVARDEEALAWYATKDDGSIVCVILDAGEQSQSNCLPVADTGRGLSVSFPVPLAAPDDDPDGDPRGVGGVNATMLVSTTGEPMVVLQHWSMPSTAPSQFAGDERTRAEELVDAGFAFTIEIVGYFRTAPVWVGDRLSHEGEIEKCLVVDAVDLTACASLDAAAESGIEARIDDVDGASGGVVGSSVLEARFTRWQTPYLTITDAPVTGAEPGDTVRVDAPPGDPIVVEPPGRDAER